MVGLIFFTCPSFAQTNTFPSSGNVGIGTTSPENKLHIKKGSSGSYYDQFATLIVEDNDGRIQVLASDAASNGAAISLTNNSKTWTFHQKTSNGGNNRLDLGYYQALSDANIAGNQDIKMTALPNGNIGIGITEPTSRLSINGTTKTKEVIVTDQSSDWPDFVFNKGYKMQDLLELEAFVQSNKHLPGLPAGEEVELNGQHLGAIQAKLLQKIEELTLYTIEQQKRIEALEKKLQLLMREK